MAEAALQYCWRQRLAAASAASAAGGPRGSDQTRPAVAARPDSQQAFPSATARTMAPRCRLAVLGTHHHQQREQRVWPLWGLQRAPLRPVRSAPQMSPGVAACPAPPSHQEKTRLDLEPRVTACLAMVAMVTWPLENQVAMARVREHACDGREQAAPFCFAPFALMFGRQLKIT